MIVIVNATPVIALSSIDQLELLPELFDEVIVPLTVYREVALEGAGRPGAEAVASASWIQVRTPAASPNLEILLLGLDAGELGCRV